MHGACRSFEDDNEPNSPAWRLEAYVPEREQLVHIPIDRSPFLIGRQSECHLTLSAPGISSQHASLTLSAESIEVKDLGSTNGTFLNARRIEGAASATNGDILHFANSEFRLMRAGEPIEKRITATEMLPPDPESILSQSDLLRSLLSNRAVNAVFQPIVDLRDTSPIGFEGLGRGAEEGLSPSPALLLRLASLIGAEVELSVLFRERCLEELNASLPDGKTVRAFVNAAQSEPHSSGFVEGVIEQVELYPQLEIVVEIHERSIVDLALMRELQTKLQEHGVAIAYDDFGAGESRLEEIALCPPRYLKFDRRLVGQIDEAGWSKQHVVQSLVEMAKELDCTVIAEGIETQEELEVCRSLGFDCGQGYYFNLPVPANELAI